MVEEVVKVAESYLKDVIIGLVILLIGFILGILVKKIIYKVLKEFELNKIMSKVGITSNVEKGISWIVSLLVYLVAIVLFLNQLRIASVVLYLVVGAILMLIILTFVVGLKDVIPNIVAWVFIQRKGTIKEGRRVEVREIAGVVENVGYLETEIKTDRGDILYVPNALFMKSKFSLKKEK
jgi:small-conductance mechanosensitive channel